MSYSKEKKEKSEYQVLILPSALRQLNNIQVSSKKRIEDKLMELGSEPRPSGCKKLKGRNAWRIRIGDYRVIYEIQDSKLIVTVITIGHRKNVYE
jgi:mRNA interferase RelE/StbE